MVSFHRKYCEWVSQAMSRIWWEFYSDAEDAKDLLSSSAQQCSKWLADSKWLVKMYFFNLVSIEYFNEYTIYYHATTTHGHPGTCALFKYTKETSKRQQLKAGIHG